MTCIWTLNISAALCLQLVSAPPSYISNLIPCETDNESKRFLSLIINYLDLYGLSTCRAGIWMCHLLAPSRLEALEFLHIASVESVECINEPLFVCASQGLQHWMHQLQQQTADMVIAGARFSWQADQQWWNTSWRAQYLVKISPALRSCKLLPLRDQPVPVWMLFPASLSLRSRKQQELCWVLSMKLNCDHAFPHLEGL